MTTITKKHLSTQVFTAPLAPYPREGLFHLDMSPNCRVSRYLKYESSRLAALNQVDSFSTIEELDEYKKNLRAILWDKFGTKYDQNLPLNCEVFGVVEQEKFTITKLIYQSSPDVYVTALLYKPKGEGPFPAVLQMHGHNAEGKFGINPQEMATALVLNNFVCLVVDAAGTYERSGSPYVKEYHGSLKAGFLLNAGLLLMGIQVVDNMRGIDLLQSLPYVIKDKIGATGASGGGNQTMWLAAMDDRVTAAMPIVSVGSFESYTFGMNCMCELLPAGLTITEISGILALIAPRHLKVGNALYDCNHDFSAHEMLKNYHPVEDIYRNLGYPQNISYTITDQVHGLHARQREAALGFFSFTLKGEGNGNPLPLPVHDILPEQELYLFNPPESRTSKVATLADMTRRATQKLHEEYIAAKEISKLEKLSKLEDLLYINSNNVNTLSYTLKKYNPINNVARSAIYFEEHLLPFLTIPGENKDNYTIVLHPEGKAKIDLALLNDLAKDGSNLILPDLYGAGETAQANNCMGLYHQFYRQLLWIGKTIQGEWVKDITILSKCLVEKLNAKNIKIVAIKETSTVAIASAIYSKNINEISCIDSPITMQYEDKAIDWKSCGPFKSFIDGAIYTIAELIPYFLKWGDISLLVALANSKIEFVSPRLIDGSVASEGEYNDFVSEIALMKKLIK